MMAPILSVPLSSGSDLVVVAVHPDGGSGWSAPGGDLVLVAGKAPTSMTELGSSIVAIWSRDALVSAANAERCHNVDIDGQHLCALPLAFMNGVRCRGPLCKGNTQVLVNLETGKCQAGCTPWSGQARPLSTAPLQPLLTGSDDDISVVSRGSSSSAESVVGPSAVQLPALATMPVADSASAQRRDLRPVPLPSLRAASGSQDHEGSAIIGWAQTIGWIVLVIIIVYGGRHALLTGILGAIEDLTGWQLQKRARSTGQRELHSVVEVTGYGARGNRASASRGGYGTVL